MRLGRGLNMPRRSIDGVKLSAKEYNELVRLQNQPDPTSPSLLQALTGLINSPEYRTAFTDDGRFQWLNNLVGEYRRAGREVLLSENPELRERVEQAQPQLFQQ